MDKPQNKQSQREPIRLFPREVRRDRRRERREQQAKQDRKQWTDRQPPNGNDAA